MATGYSTDNTDPPAVSTRAITCNIFELDIFIENLSGE